MQPLHLQGSGSADRCILNNSGVLELKLWCKLDHRPKKPFFFWPLKRVLVPSHSLLLTIISLSSFYEVRAMGLRPPARRACCPVRLCYLQHALKKYRRRTFDTFVWWIIYQAAYGLTTPSLLTFLSKSCFILLFLVPVAVTSKKIVTSTVNN